MGISLSDPDDSITLLDFKIDGQSWMCVDKLCSSMFFVVKFIQQPLE